MWINYPSHGSLNKVGLTVDDKKGHIEGKQNFNDKLHATESLGTTLKTALNLEGAICSLDM